MLRISIRAIGTLAEPWQDAAERYVTRLGPFAKVAIAEYPPVRFHDASDRDRVLAEEGAHLTKNLPHGAHVVALTEHGKELDTPAFADFLKRHDETGQELVFLIGGPLGIVEDVVRKADRSLSLSRLTFTHEMARVILLEQLYRAATILKGKIYHY